MTQQLLFEKPVPVAVAPEPDRAVDVGVRVRVEIIEREKYAVGCAESLDGLIGVVEERDVVDRYGVHYRDPRCLVRFDEPAPIWWTNQRPVAAFWFNAGELVAL